MKEVREERFTKREDVGFNPAPTPEPPQATPPQSGGTANPAERTNERTVAVRHEEVRAAAYIVTLPLTRRKTRQSFDIFEDQHDALKKIQLAEQNAIEFDSYRFETLDYLYGMAGRTRIRRAA